MNAAVINRRGKLQRVQEACSDTNWSRNTLMKVATEANAVIRVGRTVRIDIKKLLNVWQLNFVLNIIKYRADVSRKFSNSQNKSWAIL